MSDPDPFRPPSGPASAGGAPPAWGEPGYGGGPVQRSAASRPGDGPPPGYGSPSGSGPPPGYGSPSGSGPPPGWGGAPPQTSTPAVVALVLAVVSFVVLPLLPAVAALVVARSASRDIAASGGRLTGSGLVTAARVVAWVNVGLCVVGVVLVVLFLSVASGSSEGATSIQIPS